ncbi:MFS transporter [Corynebacterium pygosceleis]|nr:MFS transporter [Corynebacterium pygosceleis]
MTARGTGPGAREITPPVGASALGWPLAVLSALQLMVVLDGTVVNLALARIQIELGLTDNLRSWVVTSYALAYGGLLLLGGRLGDTFGRKRVFLTGVGLFTLASLACGLSTTPVILLAARVIQGIGAAIASPTAMALIVVTFAPGKARNQAFSVFAMMTGLGSVLGLVAGGALTEASWRWIFLINVPIGLLILAVGAKVLARTPAFERIRLDVRGAILATGASTLLVFGLAEGGTGYSPVVVGALILGAATLVAFFLSQRRVPNPVLPLHMFGERSRAAVFVCLLLVGALMMAMTVQVALFVQEVVGYGPLQAGLAFIPFAFALGAGSWIAGLVVERTAPRFIIAAGGLILVAGFVFGSTLGVHTTYIPDLLLPILIIGFGIGVVLIPLTLSVVAGVKPMDVGPLTATSLVSQTLGGPLGLAAVTAFAEYRARSILGTDFDRIDRAALDDAARAALGTGYTSSLLICAGLAIAVVVISLVSVRFTPEQIREGREAEKASTLG